MALRPTNQHLAVIQAGTAHTYTRISIGTGHRTPDGTETALVAPFSPVREHTNPPGVIDQATRAVDWVDGFTGDTVTYTASEAGLWATPAGGNEYLAFYDSHATDDLFVKPVGNIISHRFLMLITYAQLANATFAVAAVPQGTKTIAGVWEGATQQEYEDGDPNRVPTTDLGSVIRRAAVVNDATAIAASKTSPVIKYGTAASADGVLTLGSGTTGQPVLFVAGLAASAAGTGIVSAVLDGLRLHPASAQASERFAADDEVFLDVSGTGFAKGGSLLVGRVIDATNAATGLYDVYLDLWNSTPLDSDLVTPQVMVAGTAINIAAPGGVSSFRWLSITTGIDQYHIDRTVRVPTSKVSAGFEGASVAFIRPSNDDVYTLDLSGTGSITPVLLGNNTLDAVWTSLFTHNGVGYLTAGQNLYTLDAATGAVTLAGAITGLNGNVSKATDVGGTVYLADSSGRFYSLNVTTRAATRIGTGETLDGVQGMASDGVNLWVTRYSGFANHFDSVNLTDGTRTTIRSHSTLAGELFYWQGKLYIQESSFRFSELDPTTGALVTGTSRNTNSPYLTTSDEIGLVPARFVADDMQVYKSNDTTLVIVPGENGYLHSVVGVH